MSAKGGAPANHFRIWVLALVLSALDVSSAASDSTPVHATSIWLAMYLAALAAVMTLASVHLRKGYLTMSGIATCTGAIVLAPRLALPVGLVPGLVGAVFISRSPAATRFAQAAGAGAWTVGAAWVQEALTGLGSPRAEIVALTAVCWTVFNWLVTAVVGAVSYGESPVRIFSRNLDRNWFGAFAYIGMSAALLSYLLNGSIQGFALGSLVALLSLALADSIAGRQLRSRLQEQIGQVDRYLMYSRVVEGTIHDVRNFLAVGVGQLDEAVVDAGPTALAAARAAFRDAIESLNRLQMGSRPTVQWSHEPIVAAVLLSDVVTMMSATAASRRIHLSVSGGAAGEVRGDPLLLRQVVTNLVLNAIEAVATGGQVAVTTGMRGDRVSISVADDGPGVPDKYRDRLFEPHFTTKPSGSGIGLFVSYGIIREHRGDLLYEGSKKGAVFTILLPAA